MKSKSMCTTVGLIAMCLAGSAAAAGKPLYQTGPALSRSATATAAAEPSLQRLLSARPLPTRRWFSSTPAR